MSELIDQEILLAEASKKKILKAVMGDYVIYNRKYLAENLDRECKLTKDWWEYKQKASEAVDPAEAIRKYKEDMGLKDE